MPLTAPARGFQPLRIADIRAEAAETVSVAFEPALPFVPGQYLTLRTTIDGTETRRAYSICSGLDDGEMRIAIKLVADGRFSRWAHEALQPGHTIEAMPPEGRFTWHAEPGATRLYAGIAAGSGITPVLSILKSVLTREPGSRFVLLYGSRSTGQIIFRDALEELKDRFMGRLTVAHVLSREQQDVPVLSGRLDSGKIRALLGGMVPDRAFLCGPGALVTDAAQALAALGMPPGHIQRELFTPASPTGPRPMIAVAADAPPHGWATIVSDGITTQVPLTEHETVLDAALRAGLDLPYSCRGGMCSTCRARVTEGAVRMDVNYGLEPWETEAGFVLTCQAHPTTARVVVDYDQV